MPEITINIPDDLQLKIDRWLAENRNFDTSRLFLVAIRYFISEPDGSPRAISEADFKRLLKGVLEMHGDTLEKLANK